MKNNKIHVLKYVYHLYFLKSLKDETTLVLRIVGQYGNQSFSANCALCPKGSGHTKVGATRMRGCCRPGTWADADGLGHELGC